jgi:hypothetical protein
MTARLAATKPTTSTVVELRESPRVLRTREVWVEAIDGEVFCTSTVDLSDGGLGLVGFGVPVQRGDLVRICLAQRSVMDEGWIAVEVRWRSAERIGVALIDARDRRALKLPMTS